MRWAILWNGTWRWNGKDDGARMVDLLDRITIDPSINHGKPVIRGLRYPVEVLLELLSSGMTIDDILADYEDLEREVVLAALVFTSQLPYAN